MMGDSVDVTNGQSQSQAVAVADSEPSVRQLPKATVRLITSSQVITSVVSVIKEVVENSLDAQSTNIEVKVDNYGFDKIEIRDNGSGIKKTDTVYMAQPHYTSKLSCTDDLQHLHTYGFRGEALGSLCAVANVSITTKTSADDHSTVYTLNQHGQIVATKPSHLGQGTTITVRNLFQNLPVRKQFYSSTKKRKEEMKRVEDLIIAFGVVCHNVRFFLKHDRDIIWQKNAMTDVKGVLLHVFGMAVMVHMEHVMRKHLDMELEIEAFLPKPTAPSYLVSRSNNDRCLIFVNKRPVVLKDVEKLLRQHCNTALGVDGNKFPLSYLHITLATDTLDVNIVPNKTRVLLQDKDKVLELLSTVLEDLYSIDNKENEDLIPLESEQSTLSNKDSCVSTDIEVSKKINTMCAVGQNVTHDKNEQSLPDKDNSQSSVDKIDKINKLPFMDQAMHDHDDLLQNSTPSTGTNNIDHLTKNFMKDFDNDMDDMSFIDVSTPKLKSSMTSKPVYDVHSFSGATENPKKDKNSESINNESFLEAKSSLPISDQTSIHSIVEKRSKLNSSKSDNSILSYLNDESNKHRSPEDISDDGTCGSSGTREDSHVSNKKQKVSVEEGIDVWSHGAAISDQQGCQIQPVKLHSGNVADTETPSTSTLHRKNSVIRRNSLDELNQTSLYDVSAVSKQKPTSGYIYFSKKIRRTLVSDNPDASFQDIASRISDKWNDLSDTEKEEFEQLIQRESIWNSFHESTKPSTKKGSIATESPAHKLQTRKKRKIVQEKHNNSRKKLSSTELKSPDKVVLERLQTKIPFSLDRLTAIYKHKDKLRNSQNLNDSLRPIGRLESQGVWVCCHCSQITLFQPIRAQEEIVYRRLMDNHVFQTNTLQSPTQITSRSVGDNLWVTLLKLERSTPQLTSNYTYCTDTRLTANGFSIRHRLDVDQEKSLLELLGAAECLVGYEIKALCEILERVKMEPHVSLSDSRPGKVKHFLKSEAVRMSRQLSDRQTKDDITNLLEDLQLDLADEQANCFHGRPYFMPLYDLDDIPASQESSMDVSQLTGL